MTAPGADALNDAVGIFAGIMAAALTPPPVEITPEGRVCLSYRNEADMRAALAKLAYAYGWDVREEVTIPGWGRVDLVLRDSDYGVRLLELKVALVKPSEVRRAFQQADGYGRWWVGNKGEAASTALVAGKATVDVSEVAKAYPEVDYYTLPALMTRLATWGDARSRYDRAQSRADQLQTLLAVHRHAVGQLRGEA